VTWNVVLDSTGKPQVEHHALVGLESTVVFSTTDYKRAKAFREAYIETKKAEAVADAAQKELW